MQPFKAVSSCSRYDLICNLSLYFFTSLVSKITFTINLHPSINCSIAIVIRIIVISRKSYFNVIFIIIVVVIIVVVIIIDVLFFVATFVGFLRETKTVNHEAIA